MGGILPARVRLSSEVLIQPLEGEAIMLEIDGGQYYSMDEIAYRAWQLFDQEGATEPVVARMVQEYAVDEATVCRDLAVLLDQWVAAGLITVEA